MDRIRSYSQLESIETFEDRFNYLALNGVVAQETFGWDRYLNQRFYTSREWKRARDFVIVRDEGCDLGIYGMPIHDRIYIHHMNPMAPKDITEGNMDILDPEFLICVTHRTHNAIHYGDASLLRKPYQPRRPGDTKLW